MAGKRGNNRHVTAVKGFLFLVLPHNVVCSHSVVF